MPGSTYSTNLKIELMTTGENSGTWGDITNTNLGTAFEQAVIGLGNPDYTSDANLTITITNSNASQAARCLVLNVTSAFGSLTATRELIVPTIQKQYIVQNNTTGGQSITVKTSAGTGITVPNGRKAHLYVNGTNVIQMFDFVNILGGTIDNTTLGATTASSARVTTLNASGATTLDGTVALGNAAGDIITVPGTIGSNLIFTDNTYDIGASGATRPRNLFLAGAATVGGNLSVGGTLTLTGGVNLNGNVTVGDASTDTLTINSTITSNLIFTDNTYDIGASGATRPRNLFIAGNSTIGGAQTLTGALTVDSTTDSSSTTTGSIQTDGGVGVAKALFVGTTANVAGVATLTAGALIQGLTVGRGAGAVSTNTVVGNAAFTGNSTGTNSTIIGFQAGYSTSSSSNTFIGYAAGYYVSTGSSNVYLGSATGSNGGTLATGSNNVGIGATALTTNTSASNNTAVGFGAGYSNSNGGPNTYLGSQAGYSNISSGNNVAIGYAASYYVTGANNIAIGNSALQGASGTSTGSSNTAVGHNALYSNTTASNNTAVGYQASYANQTGTANASLGTFAGYTNTTGNNNTSIGNQAGQLNVTGSQRVFVGSVAGYNSTGSSNVGIGYEAVRNSSGGSNIGIGESSLVTNTTGANNVAVGHQAGYTLSGYTNSTFIGFQAGYYVNQNGNTAVGYQSMQGASAGCAGYNNVAVGTSSMVALTTGYENVALGLLTATALTSGVYNTALGARALSTTNSGSNNVAIGYQSLQANTTASNNTAVGYQAGYSNSTGTENVYIGQVAGYTNSTGSNNTFIGRYAGHFTTGGDNTFIGRASGNAVTSGTKNVILGRYDGNTGPISATGSNYIVFSDGDGNMRGYFSNTGDFYPMTRISLPNAASSSGQINYYNCGATAQVLNTYPLSNQTITLQGITDNLFFNSDKSGIGNILNMSTNGVTAIKFAATQVASANANTLDDYEEGSWTPFVSGDSGASGQSYSTQLGTYIKVGNLVTAMFNVVLTNKGTLTGGVVGINGLPFAASNSGVITTAVDFSNLTSSFASVSLLASNATFLYIRQITTTAGSSDYMGVGSVGNTTSFRASFSYITAS